MKIYSVLCKAVFILAVLTSMACTTQPTSDPSSIALALTPTPVIVETRGVTLVAPLVTENEQSSVDGTVTPTTQPTLVPTPVSQSCSAPEPPEGVSYITYRVEAGDTLFDIGLAASPSMTVDQMVTANCLADANRIDVGQELVIWHTQSNPPPVQQLEFTDSLVGRVANYTGVLLTGRMIFTFSGNEGELVTISSKLGADPTVVYTLEQVNTSALVGSVSTNERYYLNPDVRGRQFTLPITGDYRLYVEGINEISLDFDLILDSLPYPTLGDPQLIQFAQGATNGRITGTSTQGTLDRYRFTAQAGQLIDVQIDSEPNVIVWIENSNQEILLRTENGSRQTAAPADGDYILTVFHGGSEVYLYGDYDLTLTVDAWSEANSDSHRIKSFSTSSSSVDRDSSFTLSWDVENGANIEIWPMTYDPKLNIWYRINADEAFQAAVPFQSNRATGQHTIMVPYDALRPYKFELESTDAVGGKQVATSEIIGLNCYPSISTFKVVSGCPVPEETTQAIFQPFEHGYLVWREDTQQITLLPLSTDSYIPWHIHDSVPPTFDSLEPAEGLFEPTTEFLGLWQSIYSGEGEEPLSLGDILGWATAPAQSYTLTSQMHWDNNLDGLGENYLVLTLPTEQVAILYLISGNDKTGPVWNLADD